MIVTTVESKPLELLLNCTSAKDMWVKLNAVYDMKSDENLSLIQKQFFEFKWDSSESVAHNLSKIEQLTTKMKSLGGAIPDSMLLTRILSILPAKFNHFHSAWHSVDDAKKKLEYLTTRLMTEEVRIQNQENSQELAVALLTKNVMRMSLSKNNERTNKTNVNEDTKKKKNVRCYTCGRIGHVKKDCAGCYNCGAKGHLSRNCPKRSEKPRSKTTRTRRSEAQRSNRRSWDFATLLMTTSG